MSALRRLAAVLLVTGTSLLAPATAEARKSPSPMVEKLNQVREAHGVRPLRYSRSLAGSSARFARHLARTQQFGHGSPIWASGRFSGLGEILALAPGWELRRSLMLRYWLRSPGHRAVLLSSAFRYVGAGRGRGRFGEDRVLVWAVQFGR